MPDISFDLLEIFQSVLVAFAFPLRLLFFSSTSYTKKDTADLISQLPVAAKNNIHITRRIEKTEQIQKTRHRAIQRQTILPTETMCDNFSFDECNIHTQTKMCLSTPSNVPNLISYSDNMARTQHEETEEQQYNTRARDDEDEEDDLFEIDDINTCTYSSSPAPRGPLASKSIPLLINDLSSDEEDYDVCDAYDSYQQTQGHENQPSQHWKFNPLSPVLSARCFNHSNNKRTFSFDSVLAKGTNNLSRTSVTEDNYNLWISSN